MGEAVQSDGRFYVQGRTVRRASRETRHEGGSSFTWDFPVCTLHEAVSDDAAHAIAIALNRSIDFGEIPNGPTPAIVSDGSPSTKDEGAKES